MSQQATSWRPEPDFKLSSLACGVVVGVLSFVAGALGMLVVLESPVPTSMVAWASWVLVCIPAWQSALIWVSAASWFHRTRASVLKAALVGAISAPIASAIPWSILGVWYFLRAPVFSLGLGITTGIFVRQIACAVRQVPTNAA